MFCGLSSFLSQIIGSDPGFIGLQDTPNELIDASDGGAEDARPGLTNIL